MAVQPYEQVVGDVETLGAVGTRIWMDPAQVNTSSMTANPALPAAALAPSMQPYGGRLIGLRPGAAGELGHIPGRPGRRLQPRPEAEGG